jgi:Ala-tRNA(Pro) deacylase
MTNQDIHSGVRDRIRHLLQEEGVAFDELEHEPTRTSKESAKARGDETAVGAKALFIRVDSAFHLFVLPADRKLDCAAVKRALQAKKVRFATAEELMQLTGLVPGSVPPFGRPILPFDLYADDAIGSAVAKVGFNAGSLTNSIVMTAAAWIQVARPTRLRLSK